jgi:drug/metabolite transporter (DMT)-like permease
MTTSRDLSRLGTLLCVFSALAYTAYNLCLCDVSKHYDPSWINCAAASVSAGLVGIYLAWKAVRGGQALPARKELLGLLVIGLVTQIGGVLLVWSMSVVGVAISITLQTGCTLAASALLGRLVLGERVSWLQITAIGLITAAVCFFSFGAESTDTATAGHSLSARGLLGIVAGCLSGLAFAVLTVGVRKTVTGDTSPLAVVFLVNVMGVVALGPWSAYQVGFHSLMQTTPRDLGVMLAAGALNLVAFFLVTKSLQMIKVVRFNVLNNGLSTALTAVLGILLLGEHWNYTVALGMLLAIIGILMISLESPTAQPDGECEVGVEPARRVA